ncbi:MAG TPA: hypothetical protein DCF62_02365 [Porticoccaceae bacterium]|nr:hypothetical protein [Porticoccaceae bacterium]
MKKATIHYDAIAMVFIVLMLSIGLNVWQYWQTQDLMQKYVDAQWASQNDKANLVYTRTLLKQCDPEKYAELDVNP